MERSSHGRDDLTVSASALRESIQRHARYSLVQTWGTLSPHQLFECVGLAVRDLLVDRLIETRERHRRASAKHVYYLSIEYLLGRSLTNNLINLGIHDLCRDTLGRIGVDLGLVEESERDAALGNGGLGRLVACFLDSLATLDMPGYGYGINYDYGLFRQEIDNGDQREKPDNWRAFPTPWEIERPEEACLVPVYGRIEHGVDRRGQYNPMWMDWRLLTGVPHDFPIVGYGGRTVNLLRLFSARASRDFDMQIFNTGDYVKAVEQKIASETVSKILYPSDAVAPWSGAAAGPGVLPRRLRAQRHRRAVRAGSPRRLRRVSRQGRHPAQRHPSRPRRGRADAHPGRRARPPVGHRLGHHAGDHGVHEPHAAAGGAREVARPPARACRAAAPADHLRDQPALPANRRVHLAG